MKKSATETGPRLPAEEKTENKPVLRLKRRPLVSLTDDQMGDVAGGHPHNTCDPTCPPTCCPTCPRTCGDTCRCPEPTDPYTCQTCIEDCPSEAHDDAGC